MTKEDSLEPVFSGWPESLFSLENPKRYFALYVRDYFAYLIGAYIDDNPCLLWIYDANGLRTQELGDTCIPILTERNIIAPYFRYGLDFYYLVADRETPGISTLYQYDTEHERVSKPLFKGEIESIISISPGAHYAVVVLDNNGELDFQWIDAFCCTQVMKMGILDIQTGQLIYQSESMGLYTATQVDWLDPNTLLVGGTLTQYDLNKGITPYSLRRIHIENEVTIQLTTQYSWECESQPLVLCRQDDILLSVNNILENQSKPVILDLNTFQPLPLLRNDIPYTYIEARWQTDKLRVDVHSQNDATKVVSYLVDPSK